MRFYTGQHRFHCGIDLHAHTMYVCILDAAGEIVLERNLPTTPEAFLLAVAPYRDGLVVACECLFVWYWLADLCAKEQIPFVLGHALYMKAIHGGEAKNDRIDAHKIAVLLRGGEIYSLFSPQPDSDSVASPYYSRLVSPRGKTARFRSVSPRSQIPARSLPLAARWVAQEGVPVAPGIRLRAPAT